ncbi:AAA family ATPase [Desulfatiglans anilini]|uniref:AAA family ATPase n=1 Tax=Desulfatiglans anilini TaxID=90728 RepID=UPI0004005661|nr:AAA family ATPase [Desulfatiglans anilini]
MTSLSIIPSGLWILSAGLTIVVLVIMFGFYAHWWRRQRAFLKDAGDVAQLSARKQQLEADVRAIREWIIHQKAELQRLNSERDEQERVRGLLTDLEQRCLKQDQENETLRKEVGELENQRYLLSQTNGMLDQKITGLEKDVKELEVKKAEAEGIEHRLVELRRERDELAQALHDKAETEAHLSTLTLKKTQLESCMEELQRNIAPLEEKVANLKEAAENTSGEIFSKRNELDAVLRDLRDQREALQGATTELSETRARMETLNNERASLENRLHTLTDDIDSLSAEKHRSAQQVEQVREQVISAETLLNNTNDEVQEKKHLLEHIRERLESDEIKLSGLQAHKSSLEREIEKLQGQVTGRGDNELHAAYEDLLNRKAACFKTSEFASTKCNDDEYQALQHFKNELRERGIYFPSRVIEAFHTSLKCQSINPLTVLAGVSGTGKTLLPVKYAEHMGLHSLVIPVQPRWDSPQDLFGFYNYLEREYKATELSRALVRMDPYNYDPKEFPDLDYDWPRERVLMVLLDEMNLARTEYYFSEFLSKLELRRLVENPANPAHREKAEIELDTGPGSGRGFRIWVPENVLFVGTMNEDETTQTLSDKVLDRSNVLRFGKPDERRKDPKSRNQKKKARPFLTHDRWNDWCKTANGNDVWQSKMEDWIRRLNNGLEKVGRPFGYRVEDAIALYLSNYPDAGQNDRYKLAFADQVEQKIIPKLRGLDVGEPNTMNCLQEVATVIDSLSDGEFSSAFRSAIEESKNLGMFTWRGVTRSLKDE